MYQELKFLILVLVFAHASAECSDKKTCDECIQQVGCSWCARWDVIHCFNSSESHDCDVDKIISPKAEMNILLNHSLQVDPSKPFIQIQPQQINLKLRKNEKYKIKFKYAQALNYPMDLYYIMDLSQSMKPSKNQLANVGEKIIETMKKITNNFHIGFGSFVDKTDLPFVSTVPKTLLRPCDGCVPAYNFKNHLSLSDNKHFSDEVRSANISGNLDSPEGGFDALMQAMVCDNEIKWRKEARRIIVLSTDAAFHIAGDGKLAGIVEPNDAKCHMENNEYTAGLKYDYPSISQIRHIAKERNFYILFVVTKPVKNLYTQLSKVLEVAKVDILDDSTDIVGIIEKYYKEIQDNIVLNIQKPSNIKVELTSSNCALHNNLTCLNVSPGSELNFEINMEALDCNPNGERETIIIQPGQLPESLKIEVEVLCECNCPNPEVNAKNCSENGDLQCGTCKCAEGYYGKKCECTVKSTTTFDISNCKKNTNDSEVCSGRGKCICGQCQCNTSPNPNEIISGDYCECDNFSCPKNPANEICNNRGKCVCGECKCEGYSDEDCSCSTSNDTCTINDKVCSDKGVCKCGVCECTSGHYGKFCEECANCEAKQCSKLQPCVECKLHNSGVLKDVCDVSCSAYTITDEHSTNFDVETVKECRNRTDEFCYIVFKYIYVDGKISILGEKELQCSKPLNVFVLMVSVIGSILLIGLLTLIIWKLAVTVHDRREYAKFIDERDKSKWHREENPLFKAPITNFKNPTYTQESQ